jgi:hypothetical protein
MYLVEFQHPFTAQYWESSHELYPLYETLYDRLVPASGQADTMHGELLRSISRLHYDIFNNGLCNNKLPEIEFVLQSKDKFLSFLKDSASINLIHKLESKLLEQAEADLSTHYWGDEDDYIEVVPLMCNQAFCDQLDDVVTAIVQYVHLTENQLAVIH